MAINECTRRGSTPAETRRALGVAAELYCARYPTLRDPEAFLALAELLDPVTRFLLSHPRSAADEPSPPPAAAAASSAPLPAAAPGPAAVPFIRSRTEGGGISGSVPFAPDGIGSAARTARPYGPQMPGSPHVPGVTLPVQERPFHVGAYTEPHSCRRRSGCQNPGPAGDR